jgi:hypothetical protein
MRHTYLFVTEIGDLHLNSRLIKQEVTTDGKHGDRYYNCKMRSEFVYRFLAVRRFAKQNKYFLS